MSVLVIGRFQVSIGAAPVGPEMIVAEAVGSADQY
jgi:hypothetical protein